MAGNSKAVISSLKPQLWVPALKVADAVQFYKAAFGAEELSQCVRPKRNADRDILCAELKLGPSVFIVCDITDENHCVRPTDGTGVGFCLETDDLDGVVSRAVGAGAVVEAEPAEDERICCGARAGKVKDPFGYVWAICAPANGARCVAA